MKAESIAFQDAMTRNRSAVDAVRAAREIGERVLAPAARTVDREARFPSESIEALRHAGLLEAYVSAEFGGMGLRPSALVEIAQELARHCASTAMIWAMHQIQVGCIVHHGLDDAFFRSYVSELAREHPLLASATSEAGVGGDLRKSIVAVRPDGDCMALEKEATTVSYGESADGYLITARRTPDAEPGDQVLVLVTRSQATLERSGVWDTLGMRGTCSPGFRISARFQANQVLPTPFGDIANETMVPLSHLLWSAVWTGIAADAVTRARMFLRKKTRGEPDATGPAGDHLADAAIRLQLSRANLERCVTTYEQLLEDRGRVDAFTAGFTIELNNLKLSTSTLAVEATESALAVCGMAGYSEVSPFGVARHLRDAFSARLMISNDRLMAVNGRLLLMQER